MFIFYVVPNIPIAGNCTSDVLYFETFLWGHTTDNPKAYNLILL